MAEHRGEHQVWVAPIPNWLDHERLLGPTGDGSAWRLEPLGEHTQARASMTSDAAADLAARLRGVGIDGAALVCTIDPPLRRPAIRHARSEDARRRRATTPGFERSGTLVDDEGRWSLTPESLALALAQSTKPGHVIDAGCGAGGNTIGFARAGWRVTAIEADADRLALARHNAEIYRVTDQIRFVHADASVAARKYADPDAVLFVDPPWGTEWKRDHCGLGDLPLLSVLLPIARSSYAALWAKVPASFATAEIPGSDPQAWFGAAPGDYRRIKFVLLRAYRSSE